ncbi:MAG: DUF11 domain-containing protein [Caldilinea sp. CFX5]|nr:DUF11 domain-containing protein [Caldilinea sp. CFX5]
MYSYRIGFLLLMLGVVSGWLTSATVTVRGQDATTVIDFESPALGALARTIVDPYQPNTLVTFTSAMPANGVNVVGLVKNNATSVCVEPADMNQKFGSGRANFSDGAIGYGTAAIRADFTQPLAPPQVIAVDFQTGAGLPVRLRLFDAAGTEIAAVTESATDTGGTCGLPGQPRARKRLTLRAEQPVAAAIMDMGADTGRFVFTIDNFTFGPAPVDDPSTGQGQSDLKLAVVGVPTAVRAGESFTYTLHLTNLGPKPADAVVLTTTLNSGFTLLRTSGGQALCQPAAAALVCSMPPLAVNGSASVALTLAAHAERSGKNVTVAATVQEQRNRDPVPDNNHVTTLLPVTSGRVSNGLQAFYTFGQAEPGMIYDLSGVDAPLNLTIQTPTQVQSTPGGLKIITPTLIIATAAQKLRQAIVSSGEVSVEAWLVPAPQRAAQPAHLLTLAGSDATPLLALLQEPYGTQAAGLYTAQLMTNQAPSNNRLSATPTTNSVGQRLHLVYTRNAAGLARLYLNGTAQAAKAMSGTLAGWAAQPELRLAAGPTGEQPWLGEYQLLAFYNRALDATEVQQNYRNGPHGDGPTDDADSDDDLFGYDYEVWVDPATPFAGAAVKLGAVVHRLAGKQVVSDVGVRFYLGDPAHGGQRIGDALVERLSPRSSALSSDVTWTPPAAGTYSLYVQIDPQNRIGETDEGNNLLVRTVTVRSPATPPTGDLVAPHVDAFTIGDNQSSSSQRNVQLSVTVSDPVPTAGIGGVAFVEYAYAPEAGAWRIVQSSAWLPYQAAPARYDWQLQAAPGLKYLQAWAKDKAGNISLFPYTRYINYAPPVLQVNQESIQILRFGVQAGDRLTIRLLALRGDPDLYLWPPDHQEGRPPWVSNLRGSVDAVSLIAPVTGNYQIEIYGFTFAEYQLQIIQEPASVIAAGDEGGIDPSKVRFTQPWVKLTSAPSASQAFLLLTGQGYKTFLPLIR